MYKFTFVGINLVIQILVCITARLLFRGPMQQFAIPDKRTTFLFLKIGSEAPASS